MSKPIYVGKFYTPSPVICLINVLDKTICNPACGTGKFLLNSAAYMQNKATNSYINELVSLDTIISNPPFSSKLNNEELHHDN